MKRKWIFVLAPIALVVFMGIVREVVMHLWNWLLPMLFGWHTVTFWQAIGLLVLCRILFGGFGGHGHGRGARLRGKFDDRWNQLTPEERERLSHGWRGRCGPARPPAGEGSEPA